MSLKYKFQAVDTLSSKDKLKIKQLNIKMYPAFTELYEKNEYYSSVKPQWLLNVLDGQTLVATGKVIKREIEVGNTTTTMTILAFGLLVDTDYQHQGIASRMIDLNIQKATEQEVDYLYGTTDNPAVIKLLLRKGFRNIQSHIVYLESGADTAQAIEAGTAFAYRVNSRAAELDESQQINLGVGPL